MYHWDDKTVGYFLKSQYRILPVTCASIVYAGRVVLKECDKARYRASAICERDESSSETSTGQKDGPRRPGIQLPVSSNSTVHLAHTVCPSGHWTHVFLTCDTLSACWQQDRQRSGRKARRNMTSSCHFPFSEMFTCASGVGRVPYSLVCDHSQDCLDNSDEDFCVYRSCNGAWQFECTNKQVSFFVSEQFQ